MSFMDKKIPMNAFWLGVGVTVWLLIALIVYLHGPIGHSDVHLLVLAIIVIVVPTICFALGIYASLPPTGKWDKTLLCIHILGLFGQLIFIARIIARIFNG